jgi:hypothetical protein
MTAGYNMYPRMYFTVMYVTNPEIRKINTAVSLKALIVLWVLFNDVVRC